MELVLVISHTALAPSDWSLAFRSTPEIEGARSITIKRGAVPEDLMGGTLYKNGPALFERGETSYAHWLDGDGCVTRLHFTPNGGAEWRARFVQTEAFTQESRRDDVCWRTTFGTQRPGGVLSNMFDIRLKSPANTHVLPLPGSDNVLALWEAGPPYELDGDTLAMLGPCSLGGRLRLSGSHGALPATTSIDVLDRLLERAGLLTDACSAHPREETTAGGDTSTIAWTWRQTLVGQPAIKVALHDLSALSQLAPSPPPVRATLEGVPFAPHDMALAENFACFMTSPTQVSIAPFVLGLRGPAQCTTFDAEALASGAGSRIHLVERRRQRQHQQQQPAASRDANNDDNPARAFDIGEPYHPVHHANAWETSGDAGGGGGGLLTLVSSCWPPSAVRRLAREGTSLLGSWKDLLKGDFTGVPTTNLVRFVVDLTNGAVVEHTILANGCQVDHPSVHPMWSGRATQFVFGSVGRLDDGGSDDAIPEAPQRFGCIDLEAAGGRGELIDSWFAGDRRLIDEATLIPMSKAGADDKDEHGERAVWLIAPVFDAATETSSYVVLDGRNLADGPVCELSLPEGTYIPWGLHGAWRGCAA